MKINWGVKILILYAAFVTGILVMAFKAMHQNEDLVSEKYYENELKYSDRYTRLQNSVNLKADVTIHYIKGNNSVEIAFPKELDKAKITGDITFYKPDDKSLDFNVPVKLNEEGTQIISASKIKPGQWTIQVNWAANETPYYKEESILISQ